MFSRLGTFFTLPVFENDEEQTVRAQLLYYVVTTLILLFLSSLLLPLIWPIGVDLPYYYVFVLGHLAVLGGALYYMRQGQIRATSLVVVGVSWFLITVLSLRGGGVHSDFYPGYIIVVIVAGLLLGKHGLILVLISSIGVGLYMAVATDSGILAPPLPETQYVVPLWFVTSFFLTGAAALLNTSNRIITRVMRHSIDELKERTAAEETLARERNLLRTLINALPENIFYKDRQSRFVVNSATSLKQLSSTRQEDVLGKTDFDFFPHEIAQVWYDREQTVMKSGEALIEKEFERGLSRQTKEYSLVTLMPMRDNLNQVIGVLGVTRDITERKRIEAREQAITRGLRAVVEAVDELITVEDSDTFYRRAVELAREKLKVERCAIFLLDETKEHLTGTYGTDDRGQTTDEHALKLTISDHPEMVRNYGDPWWIIQDGRQTTWDGTNIHTIGSGWIGATTIQIGDEPIGVFSNDAAISNAAIDPVQQESIVIYCSMLGNIMKRRRAEEALRQSEETAKEFQERLRALHEVNLELSTSQTLDDLCYRAVELGVSKLGFERVGLFLFDNKQHTIRGTFGTSEDGSIRDERKSIYPMTEEHREVILVRSAERAQLYEDVDLMGDGVVVGKGWDALGVLWNGYEGIGFLSTDNYFSHQPPPSYLVDLLALYGSLLGKLITQKQTEADLRASENRHRTISELISDYAYAYDVLPDGSVVPIWMTEDSFKRTTGYEWKTVRENNYALFHPDDAKRAEQDVIRTLSGETTAGTYRVVTASGDIKWIHTTRKPEWDTKENRVIRFFGVAQDITERKKLEGEIQRYTEQLERLVEERTAELRRAKEQIEAVLNNISDAIILTDQRGQIQTTNPAFQRMFGNRVSTTIEDFLMLVSDARQAATLAESLSAVIHKGGSQRKEAKVMNEDGQEIDLDLALISVNAQQGENPAILLSAHDITYLKDVERFKSRFVENAVHDLSSPISALGTRVYLLKKTPERLADHVKILEDQIQQLKDLVADLRSLSELDRGLAKLDLELVDFNELVTKIFNQYESLAVSKNLHLSMALTPENPSLRLDRRKCERIIVNLVANAIHYTLDGGHIHITTQVTAENLIFSVQDEGIGISKEDLPHIFERFYRTDCARSTNKTGTGLGLAIVREMILAHGAAINVESEVDKGSTFTVTFPLHQGDKGSAVHS